MLEEEQAQSETNNVHKNLALKQVTFTTKSQNPFSVVTANSSAYKTFVIDNRNPLLTQINCNWDRLPNSLHLEEPKTAFQMQAEDILIAAY